VVRVPADQVEITGNGTITIYPNPVSAKRMQIEFREQPQGRYQLQLINTAGQVVQRTEIFVNRNYSKEILQLGTDVRPGQYQLSIIAPNGIKTVQTVFIE
jgi:hypothetical protein